MKKLIVLIAACLISWAGAATAGSPAPSVFQIRLVLDAPSGDSEAMTLITRNKDDKFTNMFNVENAVLLDQTAVKSAKPAKDALGRHVVYIDLTYAGAREFAEVTRQNIHKRLAIIINGQLCEVPRIQVEISNGKFAISGSFSKQEAKDLASKINSALSK